MKQKKLLRKGIGVWMDHSEARLIEPNSTANEMRIIHSLLESRERIEGEKGDGTQLGNFRSTNNEAHKHNREQNIVHAYYKKLATELLPYDDIFIFGPTTAHNEFYNYILTLKDFSEKKIVSKNGDYISENKILEAVRNYF